MIEAELLEILADFLEEKVPENRFDLGFWCGNDDLSLVPECGTAACAMGWATVIPELRAKGLYLGQGLAPAFKYNEGAIVTGYDAAEALFGISELASVYLFSPAFYPSGRPTKYAVVNRIRTLVMLDGEVANDWDDED